MRETDDPLYCKNLIRLYCNNGSERLLVKELSYVKFVLTSSLYIKKKITRENIHQPKKQTDKTHALYSQHKEDY